MQLKLYGTLREKRYNWFFKCIIYVSLHNDFLRQKIKGIRFQKKEQNGYIGYVDISICKNDKAFTVLVYFFKRISMRMGYTHFSLVCQCNTNDFLYETWFHLYSMLKKKKKSDAPTTRFIKKKKKILTCVRKEEKTTTRD